MKEVIDLYLDLIPQGRWTFDVFNSLDPQGKYQIAFSGGKDSHALLASYILWTKHSGRKLDAVVTFSDTYLENPSLYGLIDGIKDVCDKESIPFVQVKPKKDDTFWVKLVGYGYPVPDHGYRWCTKHLKIQPMYSVKRVVIAGSHLGESVKRDQRIHGCGSSECGIDVIANKIEAIATWSNCMVWDLINTIIDQILYPGCSAALNAAYEIQEANTSLRFGCFMCPVVVSKRIHEQVSQGVLPNFSTDIRALIEQLRYAPRIKSPNGKNGPGAILVDSRIEFWNQLKPYISSLKKYGWINDEVIDRVEELLSKRTYPPSYSIEWVLAHESKARPWLESETFDHSYPVGDIDDDRFNEQPVVKTNKEDINMYSKMTYSFPAIRGRQGKYEYFVAQLTYGVLLNISVFNQEEVTFKYTSQRPLNKNRVRNISRYIAENRETYAFNSIGVAIGTDVEFQPIDEMLGTLKLPIDSACRIVDGQHRYNGIKRAVTEDPSLKDDTISVVFVLGDLYRVRQIFSDWNQYAAKVSKSTSIAFDSRGEKAIIANTLFNEIPLFRKYVDPHVDTVSLTSSKLFSLNHVYQATDVYLSSLNLDSVQAKKERALDFWNGVCDLMPDWKDVLDRNISPKELKRDNMSCRRVALLTIAYLAQYQCLSVLPDIDWHKENPFWKNVLVSEDGRIISGKKNAKMAAKHIYDSRVKK